MRILAGKVLKILVVQKLWTRIDKGHPDWCRNMSLRPDLVTVSGGQLHCWGKRFSKFVNPKRPTK